MMYVGGKVLKSVLLMLSVNMVLTGANTLMRRDYENFNAGFYNFVNKDNAHESLTPQIIPSPIIGIASLNAKGNVGPKVNWVIWPNATFTKIHGRARGRLRTRSMKGKVRMRTHMDNERQGFQDVLQLEEGRLYLMWIAFLVSVSIHLVVMFGKLIDRLNIAVFDYAIRTGLVKVCQHRKRPLLARRRLPRQCVATSCKLKQKAPNGTDQYNFMKMETFIDQTNHFDAEEVEEISLRENFTMEENLTTYTTVSGC